MSTKFIPLTDEQLATITSGHCPDCSYRGFVLGPRGGLAFNIECGSPTCRARFNVGMSQYSHKVIVGERIMKPQYGDEWTLHSAHEGTFS